MRKLAPASALLLVVATAGSVAGHGTPSLDSGATAPWEAESPVVPLPAVPLGVRGDLAALPYKPTPEKVRLGRWLFYDKRLSKDGTISCASCHLPEHAFSERTPHSTGIGGQVGTRKAPSFVNAAFTLFPVFFHDGRAGSLQEQAKGPMANPLEMGNDHPTVVKTVAGVAGYRKAFREAYGDGVIDIDRIADAISCYEATRMSGDSAYDRFEAGDETALTAQQKQGRELFLGKAHCAECHVTGANFTDAQFHNVGVGFDRRRAKGRKGAGARAGFSDLGRFTVTRNEAEVGAFKTPTLRDVALHPPYMHDGSIATLKEVVLRYNQGGTRNRWLDASIVKLGLAPAEVDTIVAFLEALDGKGYQDQAPKLFPE
ncbi:MAG: cytochrome c peroxidase [Myxococcales bacterium]